MNPLSRGKRILAMSLASQRNGATEAKIPRKSQLPARPQMQEDVRSILDLSTSQLIDLPQDLDMNQISFSADQNLTDLITVSSALKVANYIMHTCPENKDIQVEGATVDINDIHVVTPRKEAFRKIVTAGSNPRDEVDQFN
ncbi:hypothetical protein ElyMa_004544900 [Elysia marginata]|uniref:Uncharacterized protein n=1 Tax=Elysia marginata TaxID=1093978 RepID=A0AAV4HPG1_9GAST|nr:hypothetical protein ElyMa_004544900 [Elysia marginata]